MMRYIGDLSGRGASSNTASTSGGSTAASIPKKKDDGKPKIMGKNDF